MKSKYANPYFQRPEMRDALISYIERTRPEMPCNPNLKTFDEMVKPYEASNNYVGAKWLESTPKSPLNVKRHSVFGSSQV